MISGEAMWRLMPSDQNHSEPVFRCLYVLLGHFTWPIGIRKGEHASGGAPWTLEVKARWDASANDVGTGGTEVLRWRRSSATTMPKTFTPCLSKWMESWCATLGRHSWHAPFVSRCVKWSCLSMIVPLMSFIWYDLVVVHFGSAVMK